MDSGIFAMAPIVDQTPDAAVPCSACRRRIRAVSGDNGVMAMTSSPVLITLTNRDRAELQSLARARKVPLRTVQRAWIVLAAVAGQHNAQIARNLGLHVEHGADLAWPVRH